MPIRNTLTDPHKITLLQGRLQIWVVLYQMMIGRFGLTPKVSALATQFPVAYKKLYHLLDGMAGFGFLDYACDILLGGQAVADMLCGHYPEEPLEKATLLVDEMLDEIIASSYFALENQEGGWLSDRIAEFRQSVQDNRNDALFEPLWKEPDQEPDQ